MRHLNDNENLWSSELSQHTMSEFRLIRDKFISGYSVTDCRSMLWKMFSASISIESNIDVPRISEMLVFYEKLVPFIESIYSSVQNSSDSENIPSTAAGQLGETNTEVPKLDERPYSGWDLKKCQKYLRKNSIWYREGIDDPYLALDTFFDSCSIESFKSELYGILMACAENRPYHKESPADVLYFFEKLESVINAGYIIHKMNCDISPEATAERVPQFYGQSRAVEREIASAIDNDKALMISTLSEFFRYKSLKKWKSELYEICLFSLSNQAAQLWTVWIDTLPIFAHIMKLVEALNVYPLGRNITDRES